MQGPRGRRWGAARTAGAAAAGPLSFPDQPPPARNLPVHRRGPQLRPLAGRDQAAGPAADRWPAQGGQEEVTPGGRAPPAPRPALCDTNKHFSRTAGGTAGRRLRHGGGPRSGGSRMGGPGARRGTPTVVPPAPEARRGSTPTSARAAPRMRTPPRRRPSGALTAPLSGAPRRVRFRARQIAHARTVLALAAPRSRAPRQASAKMAVLTDGGRSRRGSRGPERNRRG